jgi:hypothetical protein
LTSIYAFLSEHRKPVKLFANLIFQIYVKVCNKTQLCYSCMPDNEGGCFVIPKYTKYYVDDYGSLKANSPNEIKAEIFHHGPISCAIDATPLINYTGGEGTRVLLIFLLRLGVALGEDGFIDHMISVRLYSK